MVSESVNKVFIEELLPLYPLEVAIEVIQRELLPSGVFSVEQLTEWATENGFIKNRK